MARTRQTQGKSKPSAAYPPIASYGLIGDCHSAALVSLWGSIDWCCLPRFDSGSCFGRLLDWKKGGYCSITPTARTYSVSRRYVDDTLVLETTFRARGGEALVLDCFTMRKGGAESPYRQILRVIQGVRGEMEFDAVVCPRFDYCEVRPWIRKHGERFFSAIGGNDGLLVSTDADLQPGPESDLRARIAVREGERAYLSIQFVRPELLDPQPPPATDPPGLDKRLDETIRWWRRWSSGLRLEGPLGAGAVRSAMLLKALVHAPTGAMAAAPTTSLPEIAGGSANWDYRYSWIRDSSFAARALVQLGRENEADGFRRFVERSAAGHADDLQIVYGVGGERRIGESELEDVEGYRRSRPVRIGNAASRQVQLDVYGHLLDMSWRWHDRGHSPDDDYWRFLVDLVDAAAARWREADRGIWEVRTRPQQFVHSKVMCWTALERGLVLARECSRRAPVRRWTKARDEIRRAVEMDGFDRRRKVFVRAFGSRAMDAALLLIPSVGFVDYDDERMVRTTDAISDELDEDGLLRRFRPARGDRQHEGAFLPCSFWLVECLTHQGRVEEGREVFDRAVATANDLGLFSEQFDPASGEMLGNFPQGLTHLSHIAAAVALSGASAPA